MYGNPSGFNEASFTGGHDKKENNKRFTLRVTKIFTTNRI